jgi:hypothetical protein
LQESINDSQNHIDDTTDPDIFTCFEMKCTLPGASLLRIDAMDYDPFGGDDLIGSTVIDLEDRWFSQEFRALGEPFAVHSRELGEVRLGPKPVEERILTTPGSSNSMGTLQMWIDILTPTEASNFPADDVALPPEEDWEVRLVVWKARDVDSADELTDMNDLYAKVWFEGVKPQETDIHWRARGGKGSFNWRMKFKVWPNAPAATALCARLESDQCCALVSFAGAPQYELKVHEVPNDDAPTLGQGSCQIQRLHRRGPDRCREVFPQGLQAQEQRAVLRGRSTEHERAQGEDTQGTNGLPGCCHTAGEGRGVGRGTDGPT